MTTDIEDILGYDTDARPKAPRGQWKRSSRGPLHDLLTKVLPDLKDPHYEVCDLQKLAKALGMSKQGVYKWMRPGRVNQLPRNQVDRIVELSKKQKTGGPKFVPAKPEDFWGYISS